MAQLSIIIPAFNAEAYICECLDSILKQTYQDYEIICVNDGSVDNTAILLDEYAKKNERIRIITQENKGLVAARKVGIATAHGNYTTFVDSDDWLECNMYEVMMGKALKEDADIVTSGCILEYPSGSVVEIEQMEEGIYEGTKLREKFYFSMIGTDEFFLQNISIHVWNKIYKTSLIKCCINSIPDKITIGEDAACVYPALLAAKRIAVIQEAFYHYRMTEMSMMGRNQQYAESYKEVYRYMKERFMEYSYPFLNEQLKLLTIYELLLTFPQEFWRKQQGLFPYEGISRGSRIVLYGIGRFGKLLKQQLDETGWCKVVALVDQNRKEDDSGLKCYSLEEFIYESIEYDNILVSILKRNICKSMIGKMITAGIPAEKIKQPDIMTIKKYELEFEL